MDVTILNIIILVIAIVNGAFIALSKEIATKYPKLGWINKLSFRILLAIIIIVVPYLSNQKKEEINNSTNLKNQQIRDSIHEEKQLNYSMRVQNQLTNGLAKYGLKYDSAKNEIARIVSSSIKSLPDPEISLSPIEGMKLDSIVHNKCYFKITISDRIAPSEDIRIESFFISLKNGEYLLIDNPYKNNYAFPFGENLGTGVSYSFDVNFPYNNASTIYCYLKGTYRNMGKNKTYHINNIYSYEIKNKTFGMPIGPFYEDIQKYLKEKGLM